MSIHFLCTSLLRYLCLLFQFWSYAGLFRRTCQGCRQDESTQRNPSVFPSSRPESFALYHEFSGDWASRSVKFYHFIFLWMQHTSTDKLCRESQLISADCFYFGTVSYTVNRSIWCHVFYIFKCVTWNVVFRKLKSPCWS